MPYATAPFVSAPLIAHRSFDLPCDYVARPTLPRPPHPAPNVRDDHEPPLQGNETAEDIEVIWVGRIRIYFCWQVWTTQITLIRLRKLDFASNGFGAAGRTAQGFKGEVGHRLRFPSGGVGHHAHFEANAGLRLQQADDGEQIFGRGRSRPTPPHKSPAPRVTGSAASGGIGLGTGRHGACQGSFNKSARLSPPRSAMMRDQAAENSASRTHAQNAFKTGRRRCLCSSRMLRIPMPA